jgi:capsular polysaccharide biosynthesis protein
MNLEKPTTYNLRQKEYFIICLIIQAFGCLGLIIHFFVVSHKYSVQDIFILKNKANDFFKKNEMEMMHVDDVLWVAYI